MELEVNDMKVLGAIKRGASGLRNIKNVVHLKNEELEKILDVLDQSKMITIRSVSYTHLTLPTILLV